MSLRPFTLKLAFSNGTITVYEVQWDNAAPEASKSEKYQWFVDTGTGAVELKVQQVSGDTRVFDNATLEVTGGAARFEYYGVVHALVRVEELPQLN